MDNNPPDNTESKDKSKHDQARSETLSSSDNKKILKYLKLLLFKYFKLILKVVGVVAGAGIIITISFSIYNMNTNINALSNDIATMSISLSSADAKSDSQAIVHNNTFPLGSGNATIYHKFQNPVQACWYYAATYRTQHPYTILWEIFSYEEKSKIRAIASKGIWKAHTCQRDKEVDLEKIEELLREGDARIKKSVIEDILKIARNYKNITDIKEEIENKISDNINKFRIIRLIRKPDTIVKLIGEETINHRLEATFYSPEEEAILNSIENKIENNKNKDEIKELFVDLEKNEPEIRKLLKENGISNDTVNTMMQTIKNRSDYSHIADTVTTYYSTLHFDNEGKIAHRRVKKASDYKCIFPDWFDEEQLRLSNEICTQIKKSSHNPDNSDSKEYKNEVEILEEKTSSEKPKKSVDYYKALKFYLERRKKLHHNLTDDGCGAISVEPDFVTPTGELETPSLVFLCHKNNIRSHVRIMVRENQQQKKEREDKAIQEEVKKETENKQSSEKQHKG